MTPEELRELQRMEQTERQITAHLRGVRYGDFRSTSALVEEVAQRERLERHDQFTLESVGHMVLFLRDLFRAENAPYVWRGERGLTDHKASSIVIESCFSPNNRDSAPGKPTIIVNAGPVSSQEMSVGDVKHYDWMHDVTTKTGLAPGTLQLDIFASSGGEVSDLADFVLKTCVMQAEDLCYGRWHRIQNVTKGGYDKSNPLYARSAASEHSAYCPVTLTYYYQWTARLQHRQNTRSLASRSLIGVTVSEDAHETQRVQSGKPLPSDAAIVFFDDNEG